jgi:hypothetical protein
MKENELIMMRNKIESLTRIADFVLKELEHTKTMVIGVYSVLKEMPGYQEAIALISEKAKEEEQQIVPAQ